MNKKATSIITAAIVILSMISASNIILGLGEYKSTEDTIVGILNVNDDDFQFDVSNENIMIIEYNLTINIIGNGTIVPSSGVHNYPSGKLVNLTATADTGWTFDQWTGDVADPLLNITTITMDDNKTVTAYFTEDKYTLDIIIIGSGSVDVNPDGPYTYGDKVTLTADGDIGWTFDSWSGDLSGSEMVKNIIMDGNKYVTATFTYKTPGVDIFEGGSKILIGATTSNDVIITPIEDLYYGKTNDIEVNTDNLTWKSYTYHLYYPEYTSEEVGGEYKLEWKQWKDEDGFSSYIDPDEGDVVFEDILFNNSGLWLIDNNIKHDMTDIDTMDNTVPAWFWVNGSEDVLEVSLSDNSIDYDEEKEITIFVTKNDDPYKCLIDIRSIIDNETQLIFDKPVLDSEYTFTTDSQNFSYVGNYEVWVYDDIDETEILYQENPEYYDSSYGNTPNIDDFIGNNYNYTLCGPWDPPEYMIEKIFKIEEGKPDIIIDPTTLYWGFHRVMKINITDNEGNGLDNISCLRIENNEKPPINVTNLSMTPGEKAGDFEITFPYGVDEWAKLGGNGTWNVFYEEDISGDGIFEWSNKKSFNVRSESTGVTIDIIDDGDGDTDMDIDVPVFDTMPIQQIDIEFRIYGETIEDIFDDSDDNEDDITVSGDILEDAILKYDNTENKWTATVIPKSPGEITITVNWEDIGSDSVSIDIINGTYVSTDITAFPIGEDVTISVTVKDKYNDYVKYSHVSLFWNDTMVSIAEMIGDGTEEKGKNGIYVFTIKKSDQGNRAPRDIHVIANNPGPDHCGYAKISMERNHELTVNCSPLESYAGDKTLYDIEVTTADGSEPDDIIVELYNEDDDLLYKWFDSDFEEEISLDVGTYYFYAHNDTHDNKENDTILIIHPYTVSCSPSVLAWNIDTEIDITFTVTPAGDGTLTIINITGNDVSDGGKGDTRTINIENGTGTLEGISASKLGNVTFEYEPDGGDKYPAKGMLRVTTATATPNPSTVYVNEPITVTITVTHPATGKPIPDVEVDLQSNILVSQPDNETTDANGRVQFGITTGGSGDITILIEGKFDPDNKFVIESKLRKTMIIDAPLTIDEGDTFTVNIKTPTGDLVTDLVTIEFADNTFTTSTGTLQLTAPMVSTDTDYRIRASATDYYNDEDTIRVIPKPELKQLHIIIYDFTGIGTTKFKVIVTDDTGRSITGASITFNGKEYQTSSDGVELTAPNEKRTYEITASFTGYESVSKSVTVTKLKETPGFELLALIAALGICFILLKRRRK